MSDNKKYYYLKLKDNFYDSEEMIILQNMPDGYLYSDILMKLYLRSLKNDGKLMFNDLIPYTPEVLAQVVRHQVGTVEKALKTFKQLNLIEILDNGAIYMLNIQNFIGESSTEGDRKRKYRAKIKEEAEGRTLLKAGQMSSQMSDNRPLEIEKEIKKEIKIEYSKLIEIYNFNCPNLPQVKILNEKRKKTIKNFLKDFTVEQFEEICKTANSNSFLKGNNDRGWKADFDFLMRVDKATSILEGKYGNNNIKSNNNIFEELREEMKNED